VIALLGYLGVLLGLVSASTLAYTGVRAVRRGGRVDESVRWSVTGLALGAVVAFAALELGVLTHDFSIAYIARNTATTTPFVFLLASGWAALEGSIVLWGLMLAGFTWVLAGKVRGDDRLGVGALAVMGAVAVFWFGMMASVANPFAICTEVVGGACASSSWLPIGNAVAPLEGLGPNPLLQNHILMAIHPPMLYLGYVGFTVPFAFAISALAQGIQGKAWLVRTHRWSLIAWLFLTAGIILGGWWSYEVLGWGGYWAWDPVENAAFLPWLIGTAFIHSAIVQERRGMLQAWNFVLVIATFALTILGTFLTRSGVIASVHSFSQSLIGPALLAFLVVLLVSSLALFATRIHLVASSPRLDSVVSREGFFLVNNLILTLFAFTVLLGTLYPLIIDALSGREVSIGRPFFDRVTIPLAFALLLAVGVGSIAPWRVAKPQILWQRTRGGIATGLVAAAFAVVVGVSSIPVLGVIALAGFVIGTIVGFFLRQAGARRATGSGGREAAWTVFRNDLGYWGGQISHIGLALLAVAIATSSALAVRGQLQLAVGDSGIVDGYCVRYDGTFQEVTPNRIVDGSTMTLLRDDCSTFVAELAPRVNRYRGASQAIASPAVHTGILEDVYLSIAGGSSETIALDVFIFPLQWLVWVAGGIMILGGFVALGRKVRRRDTLPVTAPDPEESRV